MPVHQPQTTSQAVGTWLGRDISGWWHLERNPTVKVVSAKRQSCSIPIPSHPTVSLLIKSVQLAELREDKLL